MSICMKSRSLPYFSNFESADINFNFDPVSASTEEKTPLGKLCESTILQYSMLSKSNGLVLYVSHIFLASSSAHFSKPCFFIMQS